MTGCDDVQKDVDTKNGTTFKRPKAHKATCKLGVKNETDRRETEMLADDTYLQAMNETYQEEEVDKTHPEINIENISIMRVCTNKPSGTATFGVKELHTGEKEEDHFVKVEPLANNKVLAKYEGKPDMQDSINVQDVPNVLPLEELPADDGVLPKYEYSHSRNVMTSQTETLDVTKMLAYMDEDEPTAGLKREEPNVRENPYSIDETYQEEDVANHEQTNGVANKKESRGSP
jgi:hypothetical protein